MTHQHHHDPYRHDPFSQHYIPRAYGGQPQPRVTSPYGTPSSRRPPQPKPEYAAPSTAPPQGGRPLPRGRRPSPQRRSRPQGMWLAGGVAGGGFLALTTLLINPSTHGNAKPVSFACQQPVQAQVVLSRDQLSTLLSIPERASRDAVREVIAEPYCTLSPVEVRQGVSAEREVYPLAFDPQTWFVVLYEEGEYAGYDFSFRRE